MRKFLRPKQDEIEIINNIYDKISKYKYGVPVDGRLETNVNKLTIPFMMENYHFLSPNFLDKYQGGICYDTANAFYRHMIKNHIKCNFYFAQCYWKTIQGPLIILHGFVIATLKDKTLVYMEASAANNNGIHISKNLTSLFAKVIHNMKQAGKMFSFIQNTSMQFDIIDITKCIPMYGTGYQDFFNNAYKRGKFIKRSIDKDFVKQEMTQEAFDMPIQALFYQESKLSTKERDDLNDSDFGIPDKRAFPIHDEAHVKAAVKMFSHADAKDKKQLAKRILSKAKKFGMDTSGWDSINEYVQESYVEESFNDFINGVNSKSKKLFFHCTEHGSTNPEDFFKTFEPRIPQWLLKATSTEQKRLRYEETRKKDGSFENYDTPRICISPSIEGALNSLSCYVKDFKTMKGKILYVYTTLKPINQYHIKSNKDIIKDKDVYDARVTGETWLLEKTTLRLYGVIKIDSIREAILPGLSADIKNGGTTQRYAIKWHWEISPKEIESDPKMKSIIEKGRDRQLQNNDYIPSIKRKKVVNEFYEPLSEFDHYFKHVKE